MTELIEVIECSCSAFFGIKVDSNFILKHIVHAVTASNIHLRFESFLSTHLQVFFSKLQNKTQLIRYRVVRAIANHGLGDLPVTRTHLSEFWTF